MPDQHMHAIFQLSVLPACMTARSVKQSCWAQPNVCNGLDAKEIHREGFGRRGDKWKARPGRGAGRGCTRPW